jgi:HK97 family phage prohead protease
MKSDFSGYATKNNIRCSDGRTIMHNAFAEQDGDVVPLVWQHDHNSPDNVLGHALLENRDDGVYCYGVFNDTPTAKQARELVSHGDINSLSIYANHLSQNGGNVEHGVIREVSLVLAGANPGAMIDNVAIQHSDGNVDELDDEAVIYSGEELNHSDIFDIVQMDDEYEPEYEDDISHADGSDEDSDGETIQDVFNTLTDKQKNVVYALIGMALNKNSSGDMEHADSDEDSDEDSEDETVQDVFDTLTDKQKNVVYALIGLAIDNATGNKENNTAEHSAFEGDAMNIFEKNGMAMSTADYVSHEDQEAFMTAVAKENPTSFKDFAIAHAQDYGIKDIGILFPDAKAVENQPELYKRDTEWVSTVLSGTRHTPFSRIKTYYADLTEDTARAKGFTLDRDKNKRKMDEIFKVAKRQTTPTTIYKKQKLDRDDIIDITDFSVVNFLMSEMKVMLDEEIARAVLIGDGRSASDEDHINSECIRPIVGDDEMYVIYSVATAADEDMTAFVDRVRTSKTGYLGSGTPTMFISPSKHGQLMVQRDKVGRRLYDTDASLAAAMGVSAIVEVPLFENLVDPKKPNNNVDALIVNLRDYTIGTDNGGAVTSFEDFDIDYNQKKYLMETRMSGALSKLKSAIVIESPKA